MVQINASPNRSATMREAVGGGPISGSNSRHGGSGPSPTAPFAHKFLSCARIQSASRSISAIYITSFQPFAPATAADDNAIALTQRVQPLTHRFATPSATMNTEPPRQLTAKEIQMQLELAKRRQLVEREIRKVSRCGRVSREATEAQFPPTAGTHQLSPAAHWIVPLC